jgi:hypothetical protein
MTTVNYIAEAVSVLLQIVVLLPATYIGVLYLLEEDGPFDIFIHMRVLAGFRPEGMSELGPDGNLIETTEMMPGDNFGSRIFSCHRCLSPYVAAVVVLFGLFIGLIPPSLFFLVVWLGLTGSTVYLFERGA